MNNKTILITGGTGSFGNCFVEYVLKNFKPKKLIIFSRDELKQFEMQKKFNINKHRCLRFFIGDIRDKDRLMMAFRDVDIVIHAAALKQVPAAEYNPMEAVKTNIIGAENIINASIERGVKKVLALSTDKAANPINLYGATKLASDKLFVAANSLSSYKTNFSVIRYGNVLSSRGSVVPFFKDKIKKKQPLPITDIEMTRFWLSLEQAVKFVIKCNNLMKSGEIFIPMLPSMKIIDLAKSLQKKINIKIIGIRDGEKLHEILCPRDSAHLTVKCKGFYVISNSLENKKKIMKRLKGKSVPKNFEYNSQSNSHFLSIKEIKKIINV